MTARPPEPEKAPQVEQSADLFDYAAMRRWGGFVLRSPLRHKKLALLAFLGVVAAAVLALRVLPKRYQVQAVVLAQRSPIMGSLSNPGLNRDWDAPTRAAREVILRRENLVSLCRQTNCVERYLEERAPVVRARDWVYAVIGSKERNRDELLEDLVDAFERRLWIESNDVGAVTLTFLWSDRDLAYDIVSAALQNFLETRHASEISMVSETVSILETHAARLQKEIAAAVPRLEQLTRQARSASAPRGRSTARARAARSDDLTSVESVLTARRRALAELEEYRQRRLAELQSELAQHLTQYRPEHPAVLATRRNIETMSAASPQVDALRGEIRDLEREVTRRGGDVSELGLSPSFADDLARVQVSLQDDDPRVEYERDQLRLLFRQYSMLTDRLDSARVELDIARAAFKHRYSIITPPQMPKRPTTPNTTKVVLAGLFGGVAFAIFTCAAVDLSSARVVESWQIEHHFGVPVLGEIRQ